LKELVVNADDFGLSPGINKAIKDGLRAKALDRTSIIVTTPFSTEAIAFAVENPDYSYGLHFDLTLGKPLSIMFPWKSQRGFEMNFFLLWFRILRSSNRKTSDFIEQELRAQLDYLIEQGVRIGHIDGHDHIHMIPLVNKVVHKLASEYGVFDIRDINESIFISRKVKGLLPLLHPRRYLKYILFRFLSYFNNGVTKRYFYSIFYSCELSNARIKKVGFPTKGFIGSEIMLHPGWPELDIDIYKNNKRTHSFLQSNNRTEEYFTMMQLKSNLKID